MALATSGAAGADLANMVNEAALRAVRCSRKTVSQEDLMEAVEVIIAGKEKKDRILSEKERELFRSTKSVTHLQRRYRNILSLFTKSQSFQELWVHLVIQCKCPKRKNVI